MCGIRNQYMESMKINHLFCSKMCYNHIVVQPRPGTGGGEVPMEIILSFLVSCAAGVACHYIIKWLDGDK